MRAHTGRFWLAIRDDATGAESRGIDVVRYKTAAFALSCAICGLAGSLYGTFSQLVSPELGLLLQTGLVIAMVLIASLFFVAVDQSLRLIVGFVLNFGH